MKVKTLTDSIMVDYKLVGLGKIIDLPDSVANKYINYGLVEIVVEPKQQKKTKE